MNRIWLAPLLASWVGVVSAGELDDLVRQVQESKIQDSRADEERKARFMADKNQQQKLLAEAKAALTKAETESKALRERFSANQTRLKELDTELKTKSGELGSLLGQVREFGTRFSTDMENSIVSAQFPGRADELQRMVFGKEAPGAAQVETLWMNVLKEMAESGKVDEFHGQYFDASGEQRDAEIVRIGAYTALTQGKYLRYVPKTGKLEELTAQPEPELLALAKALPKNKNATAMIALDPTRGNLAESLPDSSGTLTWVPKGLRNILSNEVDVGVILTLLFASIWALGIAFERWLYYRKVDIRQFPSKTALETDLTRHLTVVGTVAANAPFIGLLGTVLGIMLTFQKMSTEKGMDVHQIMVGLSVALKATAMGLLVAIPCVIFNNVLRRRIRELVTAYEVQNGS
jgi:biopolymer transport protein ExbB